MTFNATDLRKRKALETIRDNTTLVDANVKEVITDVLHDILDWSPEALQDILADTALTHLKDRRLP
jgi:restriction endonuclease Mrr